MKKVEKVITGYATTYTGSYQYSTSYPWTDIPNAFDWSPTVSPNILDSGWRSTYASARIDWLTSSRYQWYLDGIGTFKSCLNENFDDTYDGTGIECTNFSYIPDGSELIGIDFLVRSTIPSYRQENVKYFKNGTDVTIGSSGSTTSYIYKQTNGSGIDVTENLVSDGTISSTIGHQFLIDGSNNFYWVNNSACNIGPWSLSDFKNGLFTTRVICRTHNTSANAAYYYPRGFAVRLTCLIPQYEIKVTASQGGTATGSGDYYPGRFVTVKAIPSVGYKFKNWKLNGVDTEFTSESVTFEVGSDADIVAVFESNGCIMYDTIFGYKQWVVDGITSETCEVSDITDTGFTLKSLHEGNDGYTNESPKFKVKPSSRYIIDFDCEGSGWEVFVFFRTESSSSWISFKNTTEMSTLFETPADCYYISIRVDANIYGNVIRISNIRIYPADCEYMSSSVDVSQRTNILNNLSLPDRVIRHGYLFDGWNTEIDGSGILYDENSKFPEDGPIVLYSQWLLPIMFRGKFAKYIHEDGYTTDEMRLGGNIFPKNPLYIPVNFLNWDGVVFYTKYVLFGHNVDSIGIPDPTKPSSNTENYNFSHWEGDFKNIRRVRSIIAKYDTVTARYEIIFGYYNVYNEFIILNIQYLEYQDEPNIPDTTRPNETKDGIYYTYEFIEWDKQITPVTTNVIYIANYKATEAIIYDITWIIKDHQVKTTCPAGYIPEIPTEFTVGSEFRSSDGKLYIVNGYDPSISIISGDTTYFAIYEIKTYTIKFVDYNDNIIEEQTIAYGSDPNPPTPTRTGYTFIGWDKDIVDYVTSDNTYKAVYEAIIMTQIGKPTGRTTSLSGVDNWKNIDYAVDNDENTYAQYNSDSTDSSIEFRSYGFNLPVGAIVQKIEIYVKMSCPDTNGASYIFFKLNGSTVSRSDYCFNGNSVSPQYFKLEVSKSEIDEAIPNDAYLYINDNSYTTGFVVHATAETLGSIFSKKSTEIRMYESYAVVTYIYP